MTNTMTNIQVTDFAANRGYSWETVEQAVATLNEERQAGTDYWSRGSIRALLDACVEIDKL